MELKPQSSKILKLLAVTMFLVFAFAGLWLLFLAFELGGVYPPFSSHRSELDGTQVLFESLERFQELRVARHYGRAGTVDGSDETTIIVAGFSAFDWHFGDEEELRAILRLADQGGRVVIALGDAGFPLPHSPSKPKDPKEGKKPVRPVGERLLQVVAKTEAKPQSKTSQGRTVKQVFAVLEEKRQPLPDRLPWRTSQYLQPLHHDWKTVYSRTGRPVLLLRGYGKGEIVLLGDSFLLTNRAMWEGRYPDLLTWLIGGNHRVVFYERHLGVAEDPGVAWLINRYNLGGVVLALLVVMALIVWRNSVPLVPVRAAEASEDNRTASRGSSLLALVSRSLPASQVLQVCVDEWKRTERPDAQVSRRVDDLVREKGDIVGKYRQIVKQLHASGPQRFDAGRRPTQPSRHSTAAEGLNDRS